MGKIKILGLFLVLTVCFGTIRTGASEEWGYDFVSEDSPDYLFDETEESVDITGYNDDNVETIDGSDDEGVFGDERGVYEKYVDFIDVLLSQAEFYSDHIKIPIKNNYDKPIRFYVWGEIAIDDKNFPHGGAVGETKEIKPGKKGDLIIKYTYYGNSEMTLVDYTLESGKGNYLVDSDYYGITKFDEPLVINIEESEVKDLKTKEESTEAELTDETEAEISGETKRVLTVNELENLLLEAEASRKETEKSKKKK